MRNSIGFYVSSSMHVALAVTALSIITVFHFDIALDPNLILFIFFGGVTGYNFIKYAGIAKLHHRSLAKNLKVIQVFSFLSFLALIYFALQVRLQVLLWTGFFAVLTLLYALPVFGKKRNLRTVGGIKVYIIAIIWSGISVFLPIKDAGMAISIGVAIEFLQRFLFVLVLLLPFEIRDLKYDHPELKTIPQQLGVKRTKILGFGMLTVFVVLESFKGSFDSVRTAGVVSIALVTAGMLFKTSEDQPRYFSSFWVEGIPVLWLLILFLFRNCPASFF